MTTTEILKQIDLKIEIVEEMIKERESKNKDTMWHDGFLTALKMIREDITSN